MTLVPSFVDLLQPLAVAMTVPTFDTLLTVLAGWVYARRRTVAGMIVAADAVGRRHHSAFHRLFAQASWSLNALGLAVFALIEPWLDPDAAVMACPLNKGECSGSTLRTPLPPLKLSIGIIRIPVNPRASTKRTLHLRLARPLAAGTGCKRPG